MHPVTLAGEPTRNFEVDVADNGDATFVWTTPQAPPNTKVKGRRLGFASQSLSAVVDISVPPSPNLSDESRVVVDPAGDATFVWRRSTSAPSAFLVETRQLSAAGSLGPTQVVNAPGTTSQSHSVAVDDSGRARIT